MKIKTIQAVNAYNIIKDLKVANLNEDDIISLWNNIKLLRPVSDEYTKSVEEAKKSLQNDEYNAMVQRVRVAQDRENKVKEGTYTMTEDDLKDIKEINDYFAEFNKKGNEYFKTLEDTEIDIDIKQISDKELIKVIKENDNVFDTMLKLDFMIKQSV